MRSIHSGKYLLDEVVGLQLRRRSAIQWVDVKYVNPRQV